MKRDTISGDTDALRVALIRRTRQNTVVVWGVAQVLFPFEVGRSVDTLAPYSSASENEIRETLCGSSAHGDFQAGLQTLEQFFRHCRNKLGLTCTLGDFAAAYGAAWGKPAPTFEIVRECVGNARVAMLGNIDQVVHAHLNRTWVDTLGLFPGERRILSFRTNVRLPDPAMYNLLMARVPASRYVYVDNDPTNLDVAASLGWDTIHFTLED